MIVTNDLTWNAHVENLVKKLKFRLFTLRRLSHCIPRELLKSVACGIFLSVIRYGLPLYCPLRLREEDWLSLQQRIFPRLLLEEVGHIRLKITTKRLFDFCAICFAAFISAPRIIQQKNPSMGQRSAARNIPLFCLKLCPILWGFVSAETIC